MQLPVWQAFQKTIPKNKFQMVGMAIDAQGPKVAKPWVEKGGVEYPVLCDEKNILLPPLGVFFVPALIWVNEKGEIVRGPEKSTGKKEQLDLVRQWIEKGDSVLINRKDQKTAQWIPLTPNQQKAQDLFNKGNQMIQDGKPAKLVVPVWEEAFKLDPDNWLIRKQYWALKAPDKFYNTGDTPDYKWQRKQIKKGD